MASYEVAVDGDDGVVLCRLIAPLSDIEAGRLAAELVETIEAAHSAWGRLRLLVDNRVGVSFASPAMTAMSDRLRDAYAPGDRIAVILPSSLCKVVAKPRLDADSQSFLSESAALTWLTAWDLDRGRPATPQQIFS